MYVCSMKFNITNQNSNWEISFIFALTYLSERAKNRNVHSPEWVRLQYCWNCCRTKQTEIAGPVENERTSQVEVT